MHSVLSAGQVPAFRPASAANPGPSGLPVDSVTVTPGENVAPASIAMPPGVVVASGGVFGFFAANAVQTELEHQVQRLQSQGVVFERQGHFLFWRTGWKTSTSAKAAKLARKGEAGELRARRQGGAAVAVDNPQDLRELDAFYGAGDPSRLAQGSLAGTLDALEKADFSFRADGDSRSCGAYGAYNFLIGDPHGAGSLTLKTGDESVTLDSPEIAHLAAFFHGLEPTRDLTRPDQAELLKTLRAGGYELSRNAFDAYKALGRGESFEVGLDKVPLVTISPDNVGSALTTLGLSRERYGTLKAALGERAPAVWAELRGDSPRPYREREEVARRVFGSGVGQPELLYRAILASAGESETLGQAARPALDLLPLMEGKPGEEAVRAYRFLREKLADVDHPTEKKLRYLDLLSLTGEVEASGRALQALCNGPEEFYSHRLEFFRRMLGAGAAPRTAVELLEELTARGRVLEDAGMTLALVEARPEPAALEVYRYLQDQVPEKLWKPFVDMYDHHPRLPEMTAAWDAILQRGQEAAPGLAHAWSLLVAAAAASPKPDEVATQALARLESVGGDLLGRAADFSRVLKLAGGDLDQAAEKYAEVRSHEDPETLLALFEATKNLDDGRSAVLQLGRIPSTRSLEERRHALVGALKLAGGELKAGLREYAFLLSSVPSQQSLEPVVESYLAFEAATGSRSEARKALAAWLAQGSSPQSAESMGAALQATGAFHLAQPLWRDLEELPEQRSARLASLGKAAELVGTYDPDGTAAAYRLLRQVPQDPAHLEVVGSLLERTRRPGWSPSGSWGRLEVPGRGKVWTESPEGNYPDRADMALTSEPVSMRGLFGCRLEFETRYKTEDCDSMKIEASTDGEHWTALDSFSGTGEWGPRSVDLSAYDGAEVRLRFRFTSDSSRNYDGVLLDRIRLTGTRAGRELAVSWKSEGTWGEVQDPDKGRVWTDSPGHHYANNADEKLVARKLSLRGLTRSRLVFQERHQTEERHDACFVEARSGDGEWKELSRYTGSSSSWNAHSVDLSAYDGQEVGLRFRMHSDGSNVADGFYLADTRVVGTSAGNRPVVLEFGDTLRGDPVSREQMLDSIGSAADPAEALRQMEALLRETGTPAGVLEVFKELEPFLGRRDVDDHRRALVRLKRALPPEQVVSWHTRLEKEVRFGESLADLAVCLTEVGPERFASLRSDLAEAAVEPGQLEGNTHLFAAVADRGGQELAWEAVRAVTVPMAGESTDERRQAFLQLLEAGDARQALAGWEALSSWAPPGESLADAARGYRELCAAGDADRARRAVEFIREHQMRGGLAGKELLPVARHLATMLVVSDRPLEETLQHLLVSETGGTIEQTEQSVIVGGVEVDRRKGAS
ncbi:MAG: hypothetical protein HY319_30130 [Armatimonadetes bacterium]|nr:hypothetical protein [Armatimonadota bacterium]